MEIKRCPWCGTDPLYVQYHDNEWGQEVHEDLVHFEFLVLESMQSGLSWYIVLRKRENFRLAFEGFDPRKVAAFGPQKVGELLLNSGIIRNKAKILAAINNAARFIEVQQQWGSFDNYIWHFQDHVPVINNWEFPDQIPATSALSDIISRDLKKRGFKYLGSTVIYAHMQATGMVNDHLLDCHFRGI
jgi:DNA-3-methyladenine glycosylase I